MAIFSIFSFSRGSPQSSKGIGVESSQPLADEDELKSFIMSPEISRIMSDKNALTRPWPSKLLFTAYHVQRGIQYRLDGHNIMDATAEQHPGDFGRAKEAVHLDKLNKQ